MTDVLSDDRLYERIDTGDAQSLRRLFSRHAPLTIALIAHLVGRSQAQDIVQRDVPPAPEPAFARTG